MQRVGITGIVDYVAIGIHSCFIREEILMYVTLSVKKLLIVIYGLNVSILTDSLCQYWIFCGDRISCNSWRNWCTRPMYTPVFAGSKTPHVFRMI